LDNWQSIGENFVWQPHPPIGWSYRIAEINSKTLLSLDHSGTYSFGRSSVLLAQGSASDPLTVSVPGRSVISNGDFMSGLWAAVGDCNDLLGPQGIQYLKAEILAHAGPAAGPALRLSAAADGACEAESLNWREGPVVLTLMVHAVKGSGPRICIWESGPQLCALTPAIPATSGWFSYHAAITPDPGTTALSLFLYSMVDAPGQQTINEYADVRVIEVPTLPSFALIGEPHLQATQPTRLFVTHESFSTQWDGPPNAQHVLVDGMLNGWIDRQTSHSFIASYAPSPAFSAAQWTSLVSGFAITLWLTFQWIVPLVRVYLNTSLGRRRFTRRL
jgi:hypothetical protein